MDWNKILLKTKEIAIYFVKWFLNGGILTIPCVYIICMLISDEGFNKFRFYTLLACGVIGGLSTFFYRSYSSRELEDNFDFKPNNRRDKERKEIKIKDRPLWDILHWVFVVGFLVVSCWIMHEGLDSLFLKSDTSTRAFVWIFSILIALTLFWLVWMITRGKKLTAYIVFYVVMVFPAFTFNFFHFYNNVSQTQRMDTSIKHSHQFVENVKEPIAERLKLVDDSIAQIALQKEIDELNEKIDKNNQTKQSLPPFVPKLFRGNQNEDGTYNNYSHDVPNPEIAKLEKTNEKHEGNIKQIKDTHGWDTFKRLTAEKSTLEKTDSLCKAIKTKEEQFSHSNTQKADQLKIKNEIVNNVVELYGALKDNILANDSTAKTNVEIIRMPDINRVEAIGELFDVLTFKEYSKQIKEVRIIEKRLIIMSISLSALIDLTPLILGLLVALAYKKE